MNGHQQLAMTVLRSVPERRVWPRMLLVWEFEKHGWTDRHLDRALHVLRTDGLVVHVARGHWAAAR